MKKAVIVLTACATSFGSFSCTGEKDGPVDSRGFSKSCIQDYVNVQKLYFFRNAGDGYIGIACDGERYLYSDPPEGRFKELSEKYGDTCYNRNIVAFSNHAVADEFIAINITSDRDFNESHKAGESLADITKLVATSLLKFIESGYAEHYDWEYGTPADYAGTDIVCEGAHFPVNKLLSELGPRDLLLLEPAPMYLKFTEEPVEKKQTFTVTFKSLEKEISDTVTVLFE